MARGMLEPPKLDDRTWQDIVNEARALIPKYAPEWTDHNPSDLGMTLIELFAWLVEGLIYRLNRVPERNYIAFLNLLGITRDPATPASTMLRFTANSQITVPKITVPKGTQVATPQTEDDEVIIFETDEDIDVLPANLVAAFLATVEMVDSPPEPPKLAVTDVKDKTPEIVDSTAPLSLTTADGETIILALGFDRPTAERARLRLRIATPVTGTPPNATSVTSAPPELRWHYSQIGNGKKPYDWPTVPEVDDGTDRLSKNGVVSFMPPSDWAAQKQGEWSDNNQGDARYWLGLRLKGVHTGALQYVLFNSTPATNVLTVKNELLGRSDGSPFQHFELAHRPLFKQPGLRRPYSHLEIVVQEPDANRPEVWQQANELAPGPGKQFRMNPVTGTIHFGNHSGRAPEEYGKEHGTIPAKGSEIRAATYRYVAGGANGNLAAHRLTIMRAGLPGGITAVTNPIRATGGSDEEPVAETMRRAPEVLRNRDRAVTLQDYEYLAREASTDVKKVRALPPRIDGKGDLERGAGHVSVIIIPDAPDEDQPTPSLELVAEVSDYLQERRVLTTTLNVVGPDYVPINVKVRYAIWKTIPSSQRMEEEEYRQEFTDGKNGKKKLISRFLHPLSGGSDGQGWAIGQDLFASALLEQLQPDPGTGYVTNIWVWVGGTEIPSATETKLVVSLDDYQIVCGGESQIEVDFVEGG